MGVENAAIWIGIGTFVATFLGPLLAVEVSRRRDIERALYQRQLDVFRTLMRTRRRQLSEDYVNALNLIEVEFHNVGNVISCWRRFLDMVHSPPATNSNEDLFESNRRKKIIDEMLSHMAAHLGMKIEHIPVGEGGYGPQGHVDVEREQENIRRFYNDVATGQKFFPVQLVKRSVVTQPDTKLNK